VTIAALAERVRRLTDSRSKIVFVPYEEAYEAGFEDMPRRVPDLTKVGAFVGFRPERTLDEILEGVIASVREARSATLRPPAAANPSPRASAEA
jgi:UDP-glucose 4-epimerase